MVQKIQKTKQGTRNIFTVELVKCSETEEINLSVVKNKSLTEEQTDFSPKTQLKLQVVDGSQA